MSGIGSRASGMVLFLLHGNGDFALEADLAQRHGGIRALIVVKPVAAGKRDGDMARRDVKDEVIVSLQFGEIMGMVGDRCAALIGSPAEGIVVDGIDNL